MIKKVHSSPVVHVKALYLIVAAVIFITVLATAWAYFPTYTSESENLTRDLSDVSEQTTEQVDPVQSIQVVLQDLRVNSGIPFSEINKDQEVWYMTADNTREIPEQLDYYFTGIEYQYIADQSTNSTKYFSDGTVVCQLENGGQYSSGLSVACTILR